MRRISAGVVVGSAGFESAMIGLFLPYAVKSMPEALSISLVGTGVLMIVVPCVMWVWQHWRRPRVARLSLTRRASLCRVPSPFTERGEDLLRQIEIQRVGVEANGTHAAAGIALDRLTDDVRAWTAEAGIADELPVAASFLPTVDGWVSS